FVWMGLWVFYYKKTHKHHKVNEHELTYINQDKEDAAVEENTVTTEERKLTFKEFLSYKRTWAFAF
ncbi:hypothetical protein B0E34_20625, partial [Chryseobacterium mucoviscidosis]